MRLRKTLKRTAAATLALSMALSAAAPAVTAAYICDVSQGSVNITVDADGSKTIQVGGQKVEDDGDGTDDIIITGDNTQAPASQNDAAEPAPAETEDEEAQMQPRLTKLKRPKPLTQRAPKMPQRTMPTQRMRPLSPQRWSCLPRPWIPATKLRTPPPSRSAPSPRPRTAP